MILSSRNPRHTARPRRLAFGNPSGSTFGRRRRRASSVATNDGHGARGPLRKSFRAAMRMGATAVEFAVIANILFVMVYSCIEFARLNMVRNLAQDAAYYAARQAVVPGATAGEAEEVATGIMGSMLANGYDVSVSHVDEDSTEVTVTVGVDLHEVALFVPMFLPASTIETQATMRTERYEGFFQQ